uniref:Uncharacterized protein n=1 Tax=Anopheles maculatus TaxID=74869 RepID=A0A182SS22_9DIPT
MRVTSESNSGPPSRTPSIMDSPTLVRVERARLRQEADGNGGQRPGSGQREDSLERCLLDPKVSAGDNERRYSLLRQILKVFFQFRRRIYLSWQTFSSEGRLFVDGSVSIYRPRVASKW